MMGPIGLSYSQYMRQVSLISEQPISTSFHELTGCQQDPRDRGVTAWYQSLGIQILRARWGMGLGHAVDV